LTYAGGPGGFSRADQTLSLTPEQRAALVDLMRRYGGQHSSGTITIPPECIQAVVHYTSRTPTHGHLREAFVVSIEPASRAQSGASDEHSTSVVMVGDSAKQLRTPTFSRAVRNCRSGGRR
jgi:hypothetical protein